MKKIKLNKEQILKLFKEKQFFISDNKCIELYDDDLIYNHSGNIATIKDVELNLELETPKNDYSEFCRKLLCNHFNIEENKVICISYSPEDMDFKIRFSPDNEITVIVCPVTQAIKNTKISFEIVKNNKNLTQIGLYRRLCNSAYFFRIN